MTKPLSGWLVLTRPVVAGFHLAGDTNLRLERLRAAPGKYLKSLGKELFIEQIQAYKSPVKSREV